MDFSTDLFGEWGRLETGTEELEGLLFLTEDFGNLRDRFQETDQYSSRILVDNKTIRELMTEDRKKALLFVEGVVEGWKAFAVPGSFRAEVAVRYEAVYNELYRADDSSSWSISFD